MSHLPNTNEYTVTELNDSLKKVIESSFNIIKVSGEISQVKKHSSGHIYFTLKDEESSISVICWRSTVPKLKISLDDGLQVMILGKITTYSPQSKYQIIVQKIDYQGEGALLKILEDRKKKLSDEGFFDIRHKKKLPLIPSVIGIITSESGAVIKDILHRISDRFPTHVILYSANVQGAQCVDQVTNGLNFFENLFIKNDKNTPDVVIIARGGGSLEDLMPFNDEALVRKIFKFNIPIVSAIGHETDITLCDFVSDVRAPTPSAAAEMIVPDRKEVLIRIEDKFSFLKKIIIQFLKDSRMNLKLVNVKFPDLNLKINTFYQNLDNIFVKQNNLLQEKLSKSKIKYFQLSKELKMESLRELIGVFSDRVKNLDTTLKKAFIRVFDNKKVSIERKKKELDILSYKNTLKRGYGVVRSKNKVVFDNDQIQIDEILEIEFMKNKTLAKKIK